MKVCSTCKSEKLLEQFSKRQNTKDGYSYTCKQCAKVRSQSHYGRHKQEYVDRAVRGSVVRTKLLQQWRTTLKCDHCSEADPACLDFHHLNANEKEENVTNMTSWSVQKIARELDKCICVCVNCHRKIHAYGLENVYVPSKFDLAKDFLMFVNDTAV